MMTSCYATSRK